MHVQSCCFDHETYCFLKLSSNVVCVVAKLPFVSIKMQRRPCSISRHPVVPFGQRHIIFETYFPKLATFFYSNRMSPKFAQMSLKKKKNSFFYGRRGGGGGAEGHTTKLPSHPFVFKFVCPLVKYSV